MQFKTLLAASALAVAASAKTVGKNGSFACGTPDPTAEQLEATRQMLEEERTARANGKVTAQAFTVETYVHVVAYDETVEGGYLTETMVNDQMSVLNDAYSPWGITFTLAGTDYTIDSTWAADGDEMAMKEALRQGSYSALNLYFVAELAGLLGYCYFPTNAPEGSTAFIQDGCTILGSSVPGGSAEPYNLGGTAIHEVGHWMNLYHTFQGGCLGGDQVDDTPAQQSASSGCPIGRDSCSASGVDPIHNYMDYSDDACYEEFTSGQNDRMQSAWSTYRG